MIHTGLWTQLAALDPSDVCRRSLAEHADGVYRLPVLGTHCRIDPAERCVVWEASDGESDRGSFHLHLASVNYLLRAQDMQLVGEWLAPEQFPTGPLFFRGPHLMPASKLEARFGDDRDAFESAGLALGGSLREKGDTAVELSLFPRLPILVVLWLGDDEFPARVQFLLDRTANSHMLLDGLWSAAHVARDALLAAGL